MAEQNKIFNKTALAEIKNELQSLWMTPEQVVKLLLAIVDGLIRGDCERRLKNDVEAERRTFESLSRTREDTEIHALSDFVFRRWVKTSPNLFADAYRLGAKNAGAEIMINNVKRAAKGRRLIGAASRAKVAKTAESFQHLSKERAAAQIAEIVNLDPGTVRRYLSELFPGNKWRQ